MRELIQAALALGWTLWRYEADIDHAPAAIVEQGLGSLAFTNWREAEQARNLAAVLAGLAPSDRLLVWCGNSHASKAASPDWTPMGHHFTALVQEEAFVIDQTVTVAFAGLEKQQADLAELVPILDRYGGTAGLLREAAGMLAGRGRPDPDHRQRDDLASRRCSRTARGAVHVWMPASWRASCRSRQSRRATIRPPRTVNTL
jgi:hypothetical protein